jgi:hypothetical protein
MMQTKHEMVTYCWYVEGTLCPLQQPASRHANEVWTHPSPWLVVQGIELRKWLLYPGDNTKASGRGLFSRE